MKRKSRKSSTARKPVERKPSPAQQAAAEYRREVVGLSDSELAYRMAKNTDSTREANRAITKALIELKTARMTATRLSRERDVLNVVVEGRR